MNTKNNLGQIIELHPQGSRVFTNLEELIFFKKKILINQNVKKFEKVIVIANTSAETIINIIAGIQYGLVVIPIHPESTPYEIESYIKLTNSTIILNEHHLTRTGMQNDTIEKYSGLMLMSSGTTGNPKLVKISWTKILKKANEILSFVPREVARRTLCTLPLSFGHGLIANTLFPILTGNDLYIYINDKNNYGHLFELGKIIDTYNITFMSSVPSQWPIISELSEPPVKNRSIRIHCASSQFNPTLLKKIVSWCPSADIRNLYGLTECLSWVCGTGKNEVFENVQSIGRPIHNSIKIVLLDDNNNILWGEKPNEQNMYGEILIYSNSLFDGFYQNENAKDESYHGKYLKTGDIGYFSKHGQVSYFDRVKTVINKGGLKIFPVEIDNLIMINPKVKESQTLGIMRGHDTEDVISFIVINETDQSPEETVRDIFIFLKLKISSYKIPQNIYPIENLPRNKNGKVDVTILRSFLKKPV
jgi:acyl-CoA synthetase (AMP-forming)/AMP-acid ligase II